MSAPASQPGPARTVRVLPPEDAREQAGLRLDGLRAGLDRGRRPQLAGHLAVLLEVALLVLLRPPEGGDVGDLGHDRTTEVRLHRRQRVLRGGPLLRREHEDAGAVLATD